MSKGDIIWGAVMRGFVTVIILPYVLMLLAIAVGAAVTEHGFLQAYDLVFDVDVEEEGAFGGNVYLRAFFIVGFVFYVLGGYVTASAAPRRPYLNAVVLMVILELLQQTVLIGGGLLNSFMHSGHKLEIYPLEIAGGLVYLVVGIMGGAWFAVQRRASAASV